MMEIDVANTAKCIYKNVRDLLAFKSFQKNKCYQNCNSWRVGCWSETFFALKKRLQQQLDQTDKTHYHSLSLQQKIVACHLIISQNIQLIFVQSYQGENIKFNFTSQFPEYSVNYKLS